MRLRNVGLGAIAPAVAELSVGRQTVSGRIDGLGGDEEAVVWWSLRVDEVGTLPIALRLLPPAVPDTLGLQLGRLQIGPGALVLDEVLAAPDQGQGEWIELRARADSLSLQDFRLRDEDGDWRTLPAVELRRGECVVLAQDSTALVDWLRLNALEGLEAPCGTATAGSRVRGWSVPWPSLNNESASSRDFADRVRLADAGGVVIDHLTWEGPGPDAVPAPPGGTSLERIADLPGQPGASLWDASTAQAGSTPGCPNSLAARGLGGVGFRLEPEVLDPPAGVTVLHALCEVPLDAAGLQLRVYDLGGACVRDLGSDRLGPGARDLIWDGRDDLGREVPPGGYLFVAVVRRADGVVLDRVRRLGAVRRDAGR